MKVGIVNSFFPPWRGGAETYAYNLSRALSSLGHRVTVLCGSSPLPPGISKEGEVTVGRRRLVGRIYGTPIMPSLLRDLFDLDVDIFHANFPSPYIAFTVALASLVRKVPAVLTWHNDLPPVTALAAGLIRTHDTVILPRYIRVYRRIIATSTIYTRSSRILPRLAELVTVVPNGVDCTRFRPEAKSTGMTAELGVEDKFVVLFVGALTKWHKYKGLDVLLGAMKIALSERKDLCLLVVGDGELRHEYRSIAAGLGISENILFLGDVPDTRLPQCYSASDIAVSPSKDQSEGFGLTILEANATSKPVVASSVGGIPSIVGNGYNGLLVPPNDVSRLAEAILWFSKNHDAVVDMGRNGRKVAEQHDWKRTAALTEQVYLQALARES